MFCGHLETLDRDAPRLPAEIVKALRCLQRMDLRTASGRVDLDGEAIFALFDDYVTAPRDTRKAEVHRRYVDIQMVIAGEEIVGFAPLPAGMHPDEDHFKDRDAGFFHAVEGESSLVLRPGTYAVFYPWDIHRPGCQAGATPTAVKKVVVKVRLQP